VLVVAATPDAPGHRPLRGAVVDVHVRDGDRPDPVLWWMPGIVDANGSFHALTVGSVEPAPCSDAEAGVRVEGRWNEVRAERWYCAAPAGGFTLHTRALSPLPPGAHLGEELVVGTSITTLNRLSGTWESEHPSDFLAVAGAGVAALLHAPSMRARRRPIRIAAEVFPAPLHLWHEGTDITETLRLREGDVLDALALAPGPTRTVTVAMPEGRRAEITLLDASGAPLVRGEFSRDSVRTLTFPEGLVAGLRVRDDRGLHSTHGLAPGTSTLHVPAPSAGTLHLRYQTPAGAPLPVHVLLRGLDGTPNPEPTATAPDVAAGYSLYLRYGTGTVHLAPGRYRVVATHGFTWSLATRELTVMEGRDDAVEATLRPVVDTSAWVSGDFHLHAVPSPDSTVSLAARVLSLACEGVDLAVATDHNRITDYAPTARTLALDDTLATLSGNELTPAGRAWGHFNAFPLVPGDGAPEDAVSAYFNQTPASLFAAVRDAGARVLQVNHPRMDPFIGYFDITHLDARTGRADDTFVDAFDAVEVFNGLWIETPDKVREGLRDAVGLVRRGLRPTLMGNSDSHALLFEEAGYPRTFLRTPAAPVATRAARALEALLRGQSTVSSGPFVEVSVGDALPGATVRPAGDGTVRLQVRVSAAGWVPVERVELWRDDTVVARFPVTTVADGVRFARELVVPVSTDAVLTVWADAETPLPDVLPYGRPRAIGFSGFLYVDADGDGRVLPPPGASPAP